MLGWHSTSQLRAPQWGKINNIGVLGRWLGRTRSRHHTPELPGAAGHPLPLPAPGAGRWEWQQLNVLRLQPWSSREHGLGPQGPWG